MVPSSSSRSTLRGELVLIIGRDRGLAAASAPSARHAPIRVSSIASLMRSRPMALPPHTRSEYMHLGAVLVEMPGRNGEVLRRHQRAAGRVQRVERLVQLDQLDLRSRIRAGTAAAFEIGRVRRAAHWSEVDVVAADDQVALGIAGVHVELRWRLGDHLLHQGRGPS